jgi:TM2 domain-containing membrane protein YozV/alkylhydroperoxidase/carboxymuconolactone decarboxylase family protein YurZ
LILAPKAVPIPPAPVRVEDRRLKMLGLVLVFAGGAAFASASNYAQWPIAPARFAGLAVASVLAVNLLAIGLLIIAAGCGKTHASSPAPRRRAALLLRLTLANLLAPAFLYAMLTSDPAVEAELARSGWDTGLSVLMAVLGVGAWRLWRKSRQYGALDADQAMARDPRPPVLYLRSFADDGAALIGEQPSLMRLGAAVTALVTPEQEMADNLDAVGPVVAIGKPGESLPELGAARLYVSDDEWQAKVRELMALASLVVVRVGSSPGLLWEIEQALAHLPRQRLVLALLGGSVVAPALVERLTQTLGSAFTQVLPQVAPRAWTERLFRGAQQRIGGLVWFDADGSAHAVAVRRWPPQWQDLFYRLVLRPSAAPLQRAWREVFSRLGLGVGGGSRSRALAVALAIVFGWSGAHWFYLGRTRRGVVYLLTLPLAIFLGFIDAFRFLWVDRDGFDTGFSAVRSGPAHA